LAGGPPRGPAPPPPTPVTAAELARVYFDTELPGTRREPQSFEVLPLKEREDAVRRAQRVLDRLSDRRITQEEKLAIAKLHSAASSIAEDCSQAVDEALRDAGLRSEDVRRTGWREGVRYVIAELDAHGISDTVAGGTRLDEAMRAFERETR
jgi:soluble cytochrome b562